MAGGGGYRGRGRVVGKGEGYRGRERVMYGGGALKGEAWKIRNTNAVTLSIGKKT